MRMILLLMALSNVALACPEGAPLGFEKVEGQKERSYKAKDSSSVLLVKCDLNTNEAEMAKALSILGEVHEVRKGLAYVEMAPGAIRVYATLKNRPLQITIVAKTPEALEKTGRDVVGFLANE